MKKIDYPFIVRPLSADDGGGFMVEFPDLPGCMGDGETVEDAITDGFSAVKSWIKTAKMENRSIPKPAHPEDYSGKWVIRTPKSLHMRLTEKAKQEGVSLNTLALTYISEGIGRHGLDA
jgi:antitoxin HicB